MIIFKHDWIIIQQLRLVVYWSI